MHLRRNVIFYLSIIFLVILGAAAVAAPLIAPYHPTNQDLEQRFKPPGGSHLLGTDNFGRDILSRIIYGSRTSLMVGIIAVSVSAIIGLLLGMIAGYFGGVSSMIIMRFIDGLMSIPMILLALLVASVLGGGLKNVMIALGLGMMPGYARTMYGQILSVRENEYIMAASATGARHARVLFRHLLPNCLPPLIVLMTMQLGAAILAEAGLSFLGVGIEPPGAAWGAMISDGYHYIDSLPTLSLAPGVAVMLVVFAFNMVGDGLRDALDPKLRGTL